KRARGIHRAFAHVGAVFALDTNEAAEGNGIERPENPLPSPAANAWGDADAELLDLDANAPGGEEVAKFVDDDQKCEDRNGNKNWDQDAHGDRVPLRGRREMVPWCTFPVLRGIDTYARS